MKPSRTLKLFLISLAILVAGFFLYWLSWSFAPGSYSRAVTYKFDLSEDSLLRVIQEIKNENPELDLNSDVFLEHHKPTQLADGRRSESDHWYHIYFYYPDKNQIVKTWIRGNKRSTIFAFIGVNDGLRLGNWKFVGQTFWWWEKEPEIQEFEERILKLVLLKTQPNST